LNSENKVHCPQKAADEGETGERYRNAAEAICCPVLKKC
jgi:hypothetical protein